MESSSIFIAARMLESPSSCSSSSIPSASSSSTIFSSNTLPPPSPATEVKTTTNYIEIGCKDNEPNYYRNKTNFHQQPTQNDNKIHREPIAYKNLSPSVKNEIPDDGYETSGRDVLTPNSHSNQNGVILPKCEIPLQDDPYNFVDDEINVCHSLSNQQYLSPGLMSTVTNTIAATAALTAAATSTMSTAISLPKKRGRKKKIKGEEEFTSDGTLKPLVQKERKKHDRFNGMPEEEVSKRTLPDHLAPNLDIIIIGINPGLFAAYKGHHYAGPGNHFWKCLYLSGLTQEPMTADEDFKLMDFGIGFTNMVERATKGSADLTRKEIKEGCRILHEKLRQFRPKIAVFNGKLIFEVFSGKKDFSFGRQPELVDGTNSYMWVMPSSSARCAQLPRAADKVPFYAALKKFRDYLNGVINELDESDVVFSDPKYKTCCEIKTIVTNNKTNEELTELSCVNSAIVQLNGKKKRGRPKKVKTNGIDYDEQIKIQIPRKMLADGELPKKKRGRPKKIKGESNYKNSDVDLCKTSDSVPQIRPNFIQSQQQRQSTDLMNSFDESIAPSTTPPKSTDFHEDLLTNLNHHRFSQQQQQQYPMIHQQQYQSDLHYHHQQQQQQQHNQIHHQQHFHQQHFHHQQQQHFHHQQQQQQQHHEIEQFSHSDLSSEISAAISSEHDSPLLTSTTIGPPDFEPPDTMQQTDETSECRFASPALTNTEQNHQLNGYSPYRNYTTNDVASKSLSGLESLVDQIPNMSDTETTTVVIPAVRSITNANVLETFGENEQQQYGNSCVFSEYTNPYQSYQSPSYNGFTGNNLVVPNFNSSSINSYHTNLINSGTNSGLFLDPPAIFPPYYSQHNYSQGHPTIHMPSPNYPYGYSHNGFGPPGLTNHHTMLGKNLKMFDRIKPDIKNASF